MSIYSRIICLKKNRMQPMHARFISWRYDSSYTDRVYTLYHFCKKNSLITFLHGKYLRIAFLYKKNYLVLHGHFWKFSKFLLYMKNKSEVFNLCVKKRVCPFLYSVFVTIVHSLYNVEWMHLRSRTFTYSLHKAQFQTVFHRMRWLFFPYFVFFWNDVDVMISTFKCFAA